VQFGVEIGKIAFLAGDELVVQHSHRMAWSGCSAGLRSPPAAHLTCRNTNGCR
jgi:hypothetical protein